jgi:putative ABC transport system permease protein
VQAYPNQLDQAVDQVTEVLRRRRNVPYNGKNNFSIQTAEMQVQEFHNIVAMVAVATVVLSSIGLLIGGVGVMNIMLVSVTERTREIGVRKALGARRRDILLQFLIESALLAAFGGSIGVGFGVTLAKLITLLIAFPTVVALWSILVALFVSTAVGLFFGIYPAYKASALDPITALRAEM